jgi:hypothetical protein
MPDDPNTENAPLDTEDWEIAFEAYKGHPSEALQLAINLTILASHIGVEPRMIHEAMAALKCAVEVLYPFTQLTGICHDMYLKLVGGKLTLEEEEALKKFGIKF